MYILRHYDWYGSMEELEEYTEKWKEVWDGSEGVEYLGRYGPSTRKFHWTDFIKAEDWNAWIRARERLTEIKRDRKIITHIIQEYYE